MNAAPIMNVKQVLKNMVHPKYRCNIFLKVSLVLTKKEEDPFSDVFVLNTVYITNSVLTKFRTRFKRMHCFVFLVVECFFSGIIFSLFFFLCFSYPYK